MECFNPFHPNLGNIEFDCVKLSAAGIIFSEHYNGLWTRRDTTKSYKFLLLPGHNYKLIVHNIITILYLDIDRHHTT